LIGQHVFTLQKDTVVLDTPTRPIVLAARQEPGPQTWRLEYDPDFHNGELSSLKTDQFTIRISYDNGSVEDMTDFLAMKKSYQSENAGTFNKVPQEVRNPIPVCVGLFMATSPLRPLR
jgi:hypothetical protein